MGFPAKPNLLPYLLSSATVVEKHWRVVINRTVVDQFLLEVNKANGHYEEVWLASGEPEDFVT